ncbi:MAG: hypothetical protein ACTSRU_02665 [Candidatus Hodarchaeales archaeon]
MTRWDEYKICKRCGAIIPKNEHCDHKKTVEKEERHDYRWKEKPKIKPRERKTGKIATYSEKDGLRIEYHGDYGKIVGGRPAGSVFCVKCHRYTSNVNGWWIKIRSRKDYESNGKRIFICNHCWKPRSVY